MKKPASSTRRISMLAYPDTQILDITGPLEVFSRASRWLNDNRQTLSDAYVVEIIGLRKGPFRTSSGLQLVADRAFLDVRTGIDTLLLAGGVGTQEVLGNRRLIAWIRGQAKNVRRLASICTGAFLLAEAGLLRNRPATSHWSYCSRLSERDPDLKVEAVRFFVRQGPVYTSAGVTAGMDLALALVEEDHGRDVALEVARALVLFLRRPGGQAQFSSQLAHQLAGREPLRELQGYILEHPEADLSVPAMSQKVGMSPRHFARVFTREIGLTPARYVEMARVETARRMLEESPAGLKEISQASGLGTTESLRRSFVRRLGIPPHTYRARFARSQESA
jgi:transcriptional regulator GlxA family with amidase domain